MNQEQISRVFQNIRASFPQASSITISIATTQKEMDRVNEEFLEIISKEGLVVLQDRELEDRQFLKFCFPAQGDINLIHNGS